MKLNVCTDFLQAKQKVEELESGIQQAQAIEQQILDMNQWMEEVHVLLQSRLDADILAGDMPKEYEVSFILLFYLFKKNRLFLFNQYFSNLCWGNVIKALFWIWQPFQAIYCHLCCHKFKQASISI